MCVCGGGGRKRVLTVPYYFDAWHAFEGYEQPIEPSEIIISGTIQCHFRLLKVNNIIQLQWSIQKRNKLCVLAIPGRPHNHTHNSCMHINTQTAHRQLHVQGSQVCYGYVVAVELCH